MRAQPVAVDTHQLGGQALEQPDYADGFTVEWPGDRPSAEQCLRRVFEGAPRWLRGVLLAGWRVALGFRPGPLSSTTHILGWRILVRDSELAVLDQSSRLISAQLVLRVAGSSVTLITLVRYERRAARLVWRGLGPVHRLIIPFLLQRASTR